MFKKFKQRMNIRMEILITLVTGIKPQNSKHFNANLWLSNSSRRHYLFFNARTFIWKSLMLPFPQFHIHVEATKFIKMNSFGYRCSWTSLPKVTFGFDIFYFVSSVSKLKKQSKKFIRCKMHKITLFLLFGSSQKGAKIVKRMKK